MTTAESVSMIPSSWNIARSSYTEHIPHLQHTDHAQRTSTPVTSMQKLNPDSPIFVHQDSVSVPLNRASNQESHSSLPHTCDQQDFQTTFVLSGPGLGHNVRYLSSRASPEIVHRLDNTNTHPLGAGVDGTHRCSSHQRNRLPEVVIEKFSVDPLEYDPFHLQV